MKTKIFTASALIVLHTTFHCQLVNYNDNGKVKVLAEKTVLSTIGIDTQLTKNEQAAGLILAAGAILPPTIDLIDKTIKEKAKKNALAYQGTYKGFTSADNFYKSNDFASLPKLLLKRTIMKTDGTDETAADIEFTPELSADKTAFRYSVKEKCIYNYSIAKTKDDYDYIDLSIEIKFKSLYINKEEYKLNDLRTTLISIPMVKVGKTTQLPEKSYSGWIPLPPRSMGKMEESLPIIEEKSIIKTDKNGIKETISEETSIKKSNSEEYERLADNTGLYEIEITVNETNPYKIKAENKQAIIESTSESSTEILKAIVKVLTTEKEEKKEEK